MIFETSESSANVRPIRPQPAVEAIPIDHGPLILNRIATAQTRQHATATAANPARKRHSVDIDGP